MKLARTLNVLNRHGIYTRPAAMIVRQASRTAQGHEVTLVKKGSEVSASSIMGILCQEATKGDELTLVVDGPNAQHVQDSVTALFNEGFGDTEGMASIPASHGETIVAEDV